MASKKPNGKTCLNCKRVKQPESFYSTSSQMYPDGKLSICKTCIKNMIDPNDQESVKGVLRQIDKPFIASLWNTCFQDSENPVGQYLRQINSLPQYRGLTWENSSLDNSVRMASAPAAPAATQIAPATPSPTQVVPPELFEKWGSAFSAEEVRDFEATYQRLRRNYKIQTAQHEEFLQLACIAQVKAKYAMSSGGSTKDAKDYMDMFHKMTAAGKLQPAQLSKADLSEGLETFGALVRRVEQAQDVIAIMPQFRASPRDLPDVVIWAYINYVRNLKGLEEVSHEEVYRWYDKRRADYEAAMTVKLEEGDE